MKILEKPWKGTIMGVALLFVLGLLFFGPYLGGGHILFPVHTGELPPWRDEMDPEKSLKLKQAVSEDIFATCSTIPLFYFENVYGFNKRVIGKARLDDRILAYELKKAK